MHYLRGATVLSYSLNSHNICLDFRCHAHEPVQSLSDLKDIFFRNHTQYSGF